MRGNPKIAISLTNTQKPEKQFAFRIKDITNERSEYNKRPKKLFIISDIEGNFRNLCKVLIKAKIIDSHIHWIFEENHLVIIGDCFDRCKEVTECLWLIYSLEEKAKKKGGYVHFILGNLEIMNMNGDWRYIHPKYAKIKNGSTTALYVGNNELWRWLCSKNIIEKIGDILFVHAGIAQELLQLKLSVKMINEIARPYYGRANETSNTPIVSILFDSNTSPFWYRGYYLGTALNEQIDETLQHFGVNTIITGHTLTSQIDTFFNGKVINVNTDHASGNSQGLLISNQRFYRLTINGKKERIK